MIKKYILLIPLLLFSCIENPFSKTNITEDGNSLIGGKVVLSDNQDSSGVFVWLKELNIQTWTDNNGEFQIKIPAKSNSIPGGGTSGYLNIYYYVANYSIQKSSILLFDGTFKYNEADLDESGNIREIIKLEKIIDLSISITKPIPIETDRAELYGKKIQDLHGRTNMSYPVKLASNDSFQVHLECNSLTDDPVDVKLLEDSDNFLIAMFFRPVTYPENKMITMLGKGKLTGNIVDGKLLRDSKGIIFDDFDFSIGRYEVHPYIVIKQNLPEGLIEAIAENADSFHEDYFKIPMRYKPGILEIKE